jgi:predicted dehydrogenase
MRKSENRSMRRDFLKRSVSAAAGLVATPYFFTAARSLADQAAAKTDRPRTACVGLGGIWNYKLERAGDLLPNLDVVALCDLDERHLADGKAKVEAKRGGSPDTYSDYRRALDRKDIEALHICVPDHWHTRIAIEAVQAGKDVYCEKPLTLTIDEAKLLRKVVRSSDRVFQVGTQQRTEFGQRFLHAVAMVHDGRIGKVRRVTCGVGAPPSGGPFKKQPPPKELNWERWLGQAPLVDYIPERCHDLFRWWLEYSGGKITDWGAHHVDIAQWALGYQDSGPKTVVPESFKFPVLLKNGYPTRDDSYNTPAEFEVKCTFPRGEELIITHAGRNGILFEGEKGRFFVNREVLDGTPVQELKDRPLAEELLKRLYKGKRPHDHIANFAECVRDRSQPVSDIYTHVRALTTCHLANIALRLDRPLSWDDEKEQIVNDDEANKWQKREQRKGYEIKA